MASVFELKEEDFTTSEGLLKLKSFELLSAGKEKPFDGKLLKYQRLLGNGSFGFVYLFSIENEYFAVKIMATRDEVRGALCAETMAKHELQVATSKRFQGLPPHASIVRMLGFGELDTAREGISIGKVLIMEYCCYGDCDSLLGKLGSFRNYLPESLVWRALWDLVSVSHHLTKPIKTGQQSHVPKLLMMDHKPDNIFITKVNDKLKFKLGDFGQAVPLYKSGQGHLESHVSSSGVPPFNAPEWPSHTPKSELFSLVQVVFILTALGAPPRQRDMPQANRSGDPFLNFQLYSRWQLSTPEFIGGVVVHRIPDIYSDDLQKYFEYVLVEDPVKRPTPQQALAKLGEFQAVHRAEAPYELPEGLLKDVTEKMNAVKED